jgi:hypothetical protein
MTFNLNRLQATESESLAYFEGFPGTAGLYGRIADLQHALGQAVAALEAIAESTMTVKQQRGAALEALDLIDRLAGDEL